MATIGDKFSQLGTSIINLVGTRASRNMDNLSTVGRANIEALASGVPQSAIGNVCTSATNPAYSGSTWDALTITGTFSGCVPAGKTSNGKAINSDVDSVTPAGTVGILASALSYKTDGSTAIDSPIKLTVFLNASGTAIARKYVASYNAPVANTNIVWYDLNANLLKTWDGSAWAQPSPVVGFKIGELTLNGTAVSSVVFDKGLQLLDAGTISRTFDSSVIPVGTVIAYMGTNIPSGFLLMDGRYLSKTTYSDLYAVIGDTQTSTAKDGYFQIADMTDGRYLMGSTVAGASVGAGLPNISAVFKVAVQDTSGSSSSGAVSVALRVDKAKIVSGTWFNDFLPRFTFTASRSNALYGKSGTVQVKSRKCQFMIRY